MPIELVFDADEPSTENLMIIALPQIDGEMLLALTSATGRPTLVLNIGQSRKAHQPPDD